MFLLSLFSLFYSSVSLFYVLCRVSCVVCVPGTGRSRFRQMSLLYLPGLDIIAACN